MSRTTDISPLSTLLSRVDAVTDGQSPPETISCGFPSIDALIGGGFRRGDLVLLGGRSEGGGDYEGRSRGASASFDQRSSHSDEHAPASPEITDEDIPF